MSDSDEIVIEVDHRDEAVVMKPAGDIDLSCSPSLRYHLSTVQEKKPERLIVNLCDVPYMDSSGVATLVEAMQVARRTSSRVVLCGMRDQVRSIFEIARLDRVFTIVPDVEAALQA